MNTLSTEQGRLLVGLTGGIGSGKSTASEMFRDLGVQVIDADALSRAVTRKGQPAWEQILDRFEGVEDPRTGEIDRDALAKRVFPDPEELAALEAIVQPEVKRRIDVQLTTRLGYYAILDSPLLLEKGRSETVDRVLVVDVPEEAQKERALDRKLGQLEEAGELITPVKVKAIKKDIEKRMGKQLSREDRLSQADNVLDNSQDRAYLRNQVRNLHFGYYMPLALMCKE